MTDHLRSRSLVLRTAWFTGLLIAAIPIVSFVPHRAAQRCGSAWCQPTDSAGISVDSMKQEFETELARDRPDFVRLTSLAANLRRRVDNSNFDSLLARRRTRVSAEVVARIRDGFSRSDAELLRAELAYCGSSRGALDISFDSVLVWEERANALRLAGRTSDAIQSSLDRVSAYLAESRIGYARDALAQARAKFDQSMSRLSAEKRSRLSASVDTLAARISGKEDSLVAVCIALVVPQTRQAALDYKRDVLRKQRVADAKIAKVDSAILELDRRVQAQADSVAAFGRVAAQQAETARRKAEFDAREQEASRRSAEQAQVARQSLDKLHASIAQREKILGDSIAGVKNQQALLAQAERDLSQRLAAERERNRREVAAIEEAEKHRLAKEERERQERMAQSPFGR